MFIYLSTTFFFFFPTGVYFGMDVFLLSQSQEMSP